MAFIKYGALQKICGRWRSESEFKSQFGKFYDLQQITEFLKAQFFTSNEDIINVGQDCFID
jgi:hypothetical protein